MKRIEIKNLTPADDRTGLTPERISAVHQALSAEERKDLAYLRVVRDEHSLPRLEMKFKNRDVSLSGTAEAVRMEGGYDAGDIASLMRVVSSLGWTAVAAEGTDEDKQEAWRASQETGQEITNVFPTSETTEKYERDLRKLAPVAEFFADATKLTVHDGVSRDASKPSPAARFLKKAMKHPKKIFSALKYAAKKAVKVVSDVYDFNEKPAVKVAATLGAAALGGAMAVTYYMIADKAHWAYDLMTERRAEEKARREKVAAFMAKGLKVPEKLQKKKFLYVQRPWIKMAGHLTVRLGGTALLAAQFGPWSGAAFIGAIVVGKALYNARLLHDAAARLSSKKDASSLTPKERREKLADTLVKSAVFTTVAALGQGYFDPAAIPGVSIGPTRWSGVDKMREIKEKIRDALLPEKNPAKSPSPFILAKKKRNSEKG